MRTLAFTVVIGLALMNMASAAPHRSGLITKTSVGLPAERGTHEQEDKQAQPARITLHESASVIPGSDGYFTLGAIADITSSDTAVTARLAAVSVGMAPLDNTTRKMNSGDIALKLRQAGFKPGRDVAIAGSDTIVVMRGGSTPMASNPANVSPTSLPGAGNPISAKLPPVIKRGDPVTIVIQDGDLSITALGQSRDDGAIGDIIRVHRQGLMDDLSVRVIDVKTVQMEM